MFVTPKTFVITKLVMVITLVASFDLRTGPGRFLRSTVGFKKLEILRGGLLETHTPSNNLVESPSKMFFNEDDITEELVLDDTPFLPVEKNSENMISHDVNNNSILLSQSQQSVFPVIVPPSIKPPQPPREMDRPEHLWERVNKILPVLKDLTREWNERMKAIQEIRTIVPRLNFSDGPDSTGCAKLLCDGLCAQLVDKRSQLVKECCMSLSCVGPAITEAFSLGASRMFQSLLQLTYVTVKVISASAHECLTSLTGSLRPTLVIPELEKSAADDHSQLRLRCCEYVRQLLIEREPSELSDHADRLRALVVRALGDTAAPVRGAAKDSFAPLFAKFPAQARSVLAAVAPPMRNLLLRGLPAEEAAQAGQEMSPRPPSRVSTGIRLRDFHRSSCKEGGPAASDGASVDPPQAADIPCEQQSVRQLSTATAAREKGWDSDNEDEAHAGAQAAGSGGGSWGSPIMAESSLTGVGSSPPLARRRGAGPDLREVGRRIESTLQGLDLRAGSSDSDDSVDLESSEGLPGVVGRGWASKRAGAGGGGVEWWASADVGRDAAASGYPLGGREGECGDEAPYCPDVSAGGSTQYQDCNGGRYEDYGGVRSDADQDGNGISDQGDFLAPYEDGADAQGYSTQNAACGEDAAYDCAGEAGAGLSGDPAGFGVGYDATAEAVGDGDLDALDQPAVHSPQPTGGPSTMASLLSPGGATAKLWPAVGLSGGLVKLLATPVPSVGVAGMAKSAGYDAAIAAAGTVAGLTVCSALGSSPPTRFRRVRLQNPRQPERPMVGVAATGTAPSPVAVSIATDQTPRPTTSTPRPESFTTVRRLPLSARRGLIGGPRNGSVTAARRKEAAAGLDAAFGDCCDANGGGGGDIGDTGHEVVLNSLLLACDDFAETHAELALDAQSTTSATDAGGQRRTAMFRSRLEAELQACRAVVAALGALLARTQAESVAAAAAARASAWGLYALQALGAAGLLATGPARHAAGTPLGTERGASDLSERDDVGKDAPVRSGDGGGNDGGRGVSNEAEGAEGGACGYEEERRRRVERNRRALADFGLAATSPARPPPHRVPSVQPSDEEEEEEDNTDDKSYRASEAGGESSAADKESHSSSARRNRRHHRRRNGGGEKSDGDEYSHREEKHPSDEDGQAVAGRAGELVDPETPGLSPAERFRAELAQAAYEDEGTSGAAAFLESSVPSVVARAFREVGWPDRPVRPRAEGGSEESLAGEESTEGGEGTPQRLRGRRGVANQALQSGEQDSLDSPRRPNSALVTRQRGRKRGSPTSSTSSARKRLRAQGMGSPSSPGRDGGGGGGGVRRQEGLTRGQRLKAAKAEAVARCGGSGAAEALVGRGEWCRRKGIKGKYYQVRNLHVCNNCGRFGHVRTTCSEPLHALTLALESQGWQVTEVSRKGGNAMERFYVPPDRLVQLRGITKLLEHLQAAGQSVDDIYASANRLSPHP